MNRHASLATVLAAALALVATGQSALATSTTPISKYDWAPNQRLAFRWRDDAVPPAWMRGAVLEAATGSNASRGAKAAVLAHQADGSSWVAYTASISDPAALAFASRRVPDLFKVWLRPQGYVFDWGRLRWCQFYDSAPDGCFDAEMVALHEFGHVNGLGHIEDAPDPGGWLESVMHVVSRAKPKTGWNAHALGPCDVAALQIRYELLDPATRVSTCLSLATTLTLASSASSIEPGSSVSFTATLRIADGVSYGRLASDPLSRRVVALQRRTVGGSGWTTHALMAGAGTAGSYRLTVTPSASYEWRALFSRPDEGLVGDASVILKISVSGGCNPYCVE